VGRSLQSTTPPPGLTVVVGISMGSRECPAPYARPHAHRPGVTGCSIMSTRPASCATHHDISVTERALLSRELSAGCTRTFRRYIVHPADDA
jgi:hypothetical protein